MYNTRYTYPHRDRTYKYLFHNDRIYDADSPKLLHACVKGGNSCRVGFTTDPKSRLYDYTREGFDGVMLQVYVKHGKSAEQALLNLQHKYGLTNHNKHKKSNISKGIDGYVYCLIPSSVFIKLINAGELVFTY
jgi:hypothetical protein